MAVERLKTAPNFHPESERVVDAPQGHLHSRRRVEHDSTLGVRCSQRRAASLFDLVAMSARFLLCCDSWFLFIPVSTTRVHDQVAVTSVQGESEAVRGDFWGGAVLIGAPDEVPPDGPQDRQEVDAFFLSRVCDLRRIQYLWQSIPGRVLRRDRKRTATFSLCSAVKALAAEQGPSWFLFGRRWLGSISAVPPQ